MEDKTQDLASLGTQTVEALGFNSEEELIKALKPLMEETYIIDKAA
ncbi:MULTISPECIES: hypothetical protein [unclassified Prochlorococcus]|nr:MULTISPECIES: hypothetical protein [unclassified Prochlorococcus]KGG15327.1 hypothetical protein EV06_1198 [Prochlorococcus sp. MIT 0602]KGG17605.1 hypothetical protein EV07_1045 [Prochlorococcus sp. MIT 0603]